MDKQSKNCKKCKEEINKKAKKCPHCGANQGHHISLIVILVILIMGIAASMYKNSSREDAQYEKNKETKVTVIDFSSMTEVDIDTWCENNKVNCSVTMEYSNLVAKGGFVSQSVSATQSIYEGDKIKIVFSLGKEPTNGQKSALRKAESYSKTMHMSKQGIFNQLTSTIEGFSREDAQYAIDNIQADWNVNALEKARSYQRTMNMSKNAIYNQLTSSIEGFTKEQAQYAIDHLDD